MHRHYIEEIVNFQCFSLSVILSNLLHRICNSRSDRVSNAFNLYSWEYPDRIATGTPMNLAFIGTFVQFRDITLYQTYATSFHILYNSLFLILQSFDII
jgi:hypothetical protein